MPPETTDKARLGRANLTAPGSNSTAFKYLVAEKTERRQTGESFLNMSFISVKPSLIATFGLALGLGACSLGQSASQIDQYSSTLFKFTFDFERNAAWQKKHTQALEYVHHTSHAQLAEDLRRVLKKRGMDNTAGAGAAYLMVLHDIDRGKNLRMLEAAHQNCSEVVEESLPDAFADIAIRIHSKEAARFLVEMPNGEYDSEGQAIAIHRLFLACPELLVSVVAKSPALRKKFLQLLPFGAWNAHQPIRRAQQVATKHLSQSHGAELAIYREVARMKADYPPGN
jgi:hypothetical protein